jgi:anti-sigma factor RsiW
MNDPIASAKQAELRAWLATHPAAQADWELEARLTAALRRLPDAPVPANFTARVLQAVEREAALAERERAGFWRALDWRRWLPRTAMGAAAVAAVLVSLQLYQAHTRARLGRSLALISNFAPALPPDSLANFDSVRRLSPAPGADTELLALLQ